MTCDSALELLSAALDGELSPAERNALDAHLAECEACAALFDELAGQSRLLRELEHDVPAGLSERILANLPEQIPAKQRKVIHWRRWGTLAACLALVLWAGFALPGRLERDSAALKTARTTLDMAAAPEMEEAAEADAPMAAQSETSWPEAAAAQNEARGYSAIADHADTGSEVKAAVQSLPIHGAQYLRVAWSEELAQAEAALITTPEELSALLARFPTEELAEAVLSYDGERLSSASLVAVTLGEGSGSVSHEAEELLLTEEDCQVVIRRLGLEVGTCDMAGWLILIETDPLIPAQTKLTVVFE